MNALTAPTTSPITDAVVDIQRMVSTASKVIPHGAKTKPVLLATNSSKNITQIDMTALRGIIEYDPGEYTFTAYAGTPLRDIADALAENGQYLPFDPPLVAAGATLGGTIAAGLSGSSRYRYGGLRDFIVGVNMIDGRGRLVRGGGKVVKNAAGFDLPKLAVGSLGRLGIIISASFKVFPAPPATATLKSTQPSLAAALETMARIMRGPYDLEALDLVPDASGTVALLIRIGGPADVLKTRLDRLATLVGGGDSNLNDADMWEETREFSWANPAHPLVKVATTPQTLPVLDKALAAAQAPRRYAVGGNLAWIDWPDELDACHQLLADQKTGGLVLRGTSERPTVGLPLQNAFLARIRAALDPDNRFVDLE